MRRRKRRSSNKGWRKRWNNREGGEDGGEGGVIREGGGVVCQEPSVQSQTSSSLRC
jgi:hypothetical protein